MAAKKFFRCSICGNIVGLIHDGGGELVCCGQPMTLLEANTSDGATEKHVPVLTRNGNTLHVCGGQCATSYDRCPLHSMDLHLAR